MKDLRLISVSIISLSVQHAYSSESCSEGSDGTLCCLEEYGLQAVKLLSFNAVLPVSWLVALPTSFDLITVDYDCICSALGAYEFSYHPSP